MTEGSYKSMDLGELTAAFDHLGTEAQLFRPVLDVGQDENYVYQAAVGPVLTSTDVRLVPMTSVPIWDVNGYYRALGIHWPYRPTRKQMRRGYQRVGGPNNDYATYSFKRLLDRDNRRRYDARPLGQPMDDDYRWAALRRLAADWAAKQSAVTGRTVTVEDILGEDMVAKMNAEAEAERQADEVATKRLERELDGDYDEDDEDDEPVEEHFEWPYAYYLWRSRKFEDRTLATWQSMIIRSCAARGLSFQVAVGYCANTPGAAARMRYLHPEGGHIQILFLREDVEPTQDLADNVVATYYNYPVEHPLDEPLHCTAP